MSTNKEIRVPVSVTLPTDISDCLNTMHGVEILQKSKKSKSEIVEEVIRKGLKSMGIDDPNNYGNDINLGSYGSTT
ncbi:hypothetical protein WAF17_16515 [Bernardetia sp. ABR2-2B]|uniref:hypothetical protein n=1 Tax=Bernardetia sp. ABR2-2B TaxID=3127472 RepID=UPI0030CEA931